jgi:hypothetical protein
MALSEKTKSYLKYALASQDVADEVILYLETDPDSDVALAAHVVAPEAHPQYLKKGSVIWCLPGGEYATLQAAIDAASAGQVILLGEGAWGNATLKAGVNIVGLNAPRNVTVSVGQLSFAPTTGGAVDNQIFLSNLFINGTSTASGVSLGGTAPVRLILSGCYVFRDSGSSSLVSLTNTDATATTVRMDGCIVNSSGTAGTLISSSVRYLRITNSELYGAGKALELTGGLTQIAFSTIETSSTTEIIKIAAGTVETTSSSLIRNLTTNGSGILVEAGGTCVLTTLSLFDVATGTGYCVRGAGTLIYDAVSFNHIPVVQPRNTKFQNTLTIIQLPTTPTLAP